MSATVVDGGPGDLGAVVGVMENSFDPAFGEAWTGAQCAGLLPMPGVWLVLAREQEAVVGFALSRLVLREAELLLLAVARAGQRRGTGRALLDRFEADADARGADRLYLEVRAGNPAVALYEAAGFAEAGRRRDYYRGADGRSHDAVTMAKMLGGDGAVR